MAPAKSFSVKLVYCSAVSLAAFLFLKNYMQIEGSEDFDFSNTKNASFTIWWEHAVLNLKSSGIVTHF
jgi:hypothetical protein